MSRKKKALALARMLTRKADGGSAFDYSGVGGAMPESYGADAPIMDPLAKAAIGLGKSAISGVTAPGDALAGKFDPMTNEGLGRTMDLAGLMTLGAGAAPAEANSLRAGIKAYHGSPHDFDKFDLSKIGTGEGAQAYGHGLYFAESPGVAQSYRDQLKSQAFNLDGKTVPRDQAIDALSQRVKQAMPDAKQPTNAAEMVANWLQSGAGPKEIESRINSGAWPDALKDEIRTAAKVAQDSVKPNPGRMYEVNINADPEHFLDWDKPVSEQPRVLAALKKMGVNTDAFDLERSTPGQIVPDRIANEVLPLGQATDANISAALRDAGIPGIKYLDQGSRTAGEGSHNYVVWDDKLLDIMRKYGLAGLTAGGLAAGSQNGDDHMKRGGAIRKAVRVARLHKADGGDISSPNYVQANKDMNLTPQEQALYQRHLTNLNGPGGVDNPDGSRSTLYQAVQEHNGKFYSIPTVWNGARETQSYTKPDGTTMDVPNDTALANVAKTGWDKFPAYNTPDEADERYGQMHDYLDKDTSQYFQNKAANMPTGDEIQPMKRGGVSRALGVAKGAPAFEGYIPGATGGRTDNKDISVKSGSYVVPADILSGLGEGNSHAGWAAIAKEYGLDKPHKADGGAADAVPIVAASGEGVIPPSSIIAKHGDLDTGHAILDAMVKHVRSRTIKHLKKLPGPKRN